MGELVHLGELWIDPSSIVAVKHISGKASVHAWERERYIIYLSNGEVIEVIDPDTIRAINEYFNEKGRQANG